MESFTDAVRKRRSSSCHFQEFKKEPLDVSYEKEDLELSGCCLGTPINRKDLKENLEFKQNQKSKRSEVTIKIVKKFRRRVRKYAKQRNNLNDLKYYLGQSGHWRLRGKRFKVYVNFDDKLDEDWITNIINAGRIIQEFTPGIVFLGPRSSKVHDFSIYIVAIDEDDAYTKGNIFESKEGTISFCNKWEWHRQGTALHEIMHALGFEHEHQRKDRDFYVNVRESADSQYTIVWFSKVITPFDPFSVMLYGENEVMQRDSRGRQWKLK